MRTKISKEKIGELAKRSHAKCRGTGILGYRPGSEGTVITTLCSCVYRNLRRRGVDTKNQAAVMEYLAPDPPKETTAALSTLAPVPGHPPGWPYDKINRPGPIKADA